MTFFAKFDHIALGIEKMIDGADFIAGELGGAPHEGGPGPGYTGAQWRFQGGARLEVIEPAGPPGGFLHRFLHSRGPGIHHVTFIVANLREAADRAEALGYDVVGYQDAHPAWKEAFLHPKQAQGIVVQLAQKGPGDDGWGAGFDFPAPSFRPKPAVRIIGLAMSAPEPASPRRQWGELLGGQLQERGSRLLFSYPDSPMRIAVDVDRSNSFAATAIEITAERPVDAPLGPHPVLGARFVVKRP